MLTSDQKTDTRPAVAVGLVCCIVFCSGCGNAGRVKVYPASGTVTIDGQPAKSVKLVLQGAVADKIPPATASVSETGSFTLSTYGTGDGVAEGKFSVFVMSDPMTMKPVPATSEKTVDVKRDSSGKIPPLNVDLVSAKGAKATIGAPLPIPGGAPPTPGGAMNPIAR